MVSHRVKCVSPGHRITWQFSGMFCRLQKQFNAKCNKHIYCELSCGGLLRVALLSATDSRVGRDRNVVLRYFALQAHSLLPGKRKYNNIQLKLELYFVS